MNPIVPNDPLYRYQRLARDAWESGYEHWRKMQAVLAEAERIYTVSPVVSVVIPILAEVGN